MEPKLAKRKIHYTGTFFYKNEAQICPKIKNELRTTEARLQMQT